MFGGFFGGYAPTGRFEASYRCYPVSFIDRVDAEKGDKVFLPPSALDRLCEHRDPWLTTPSLPPSAHARAFH